MDDSLSNMNMDMDERAVPLCATGSPLRRRLPSPCATAQKEPFFPTFLSPGEEADEHEQQSPPETCAESKVFPHNIVSSYGGKHVPIAFAGKHAAKALATLMPEQDEATSVDKSEECTKNDFDGSPHQLLQESLETVNSLSESDNADEDELVGLNEGKCCTHTDCGSKEGNCAYSNDNTRPTKKCPFKNEESDAHKNFSLCDRGRVQLTVFRARNCAELRSGSHIQVPTPLVGRMAPRSKDGSFPSLDSIEHGRKGDLLLRNGVGSKNHVSNLNSASENKGNSKEFPRSNRSGFVLATTRSYPRGDDTETDDSDGETSSSSSSSASSAGGRGLFLDAMPSDAGNSESEVSSNDEDGDSEESSNEEESDDGQDVDSDSDEVEIEQDSGEESSSSKSHYEGDSETTGDTDDDNECPPGAYPCVTRSSTDEVLQREQGSSTIEIELQNALQDEEDNMEISSRELNRARRSGSLTQEEVEELMYQSKKEVQESDLVFSDNEEKVSLSRCANAPDVNRSVSDKEIVDLVSGALQFDCWSSRSLSTAVSILSSVCSGAGGESASNPISMPPSALTSFWLDELLFALSSQAQQYLLLHPALRPRASEIVHGVFLGEMSHLDLARVDLSNVVGHAEKLGESKHLYVGSVQSLESRISLAMFGIKRVISLAVHPLDELWSKDGVQYTTHVMRNVASSDGCDAAALCNAVYTAAHEVSASLAKGDKVLVTCATGNDHACAVCAVYLITNFGFDLDSAMDRMRNCRPSAKVDSSLLEKSILVNKEAQEEITPESQKAKRVLSCQMLSQLSLMPSLSSLGESPKRQRSTSSRNPVNDKASIAEQGLPDLPTFMLGPPAMDRGMQARLSIRLPDNEDSSTDNDAIEELEEFDRNSSGEGESSPVPLLTPPVSPRQLQPTCETPSVCEWPSNIVVDSAITSAIALPPLSPKSLQRKEEELGCKEAFFEPFLTPRVDHGQEQNMSTGLTPRLGGISVTLRSPAL